MSKKDVSDMRGLLREAGWELDRKASTSHEVWRWPPTGGTIGLPCTPSDHRWWENTLADARRVSGQALVAKSNAGHFRHAKWSGFSLTVSERERAQRERRADKLLDEIDELHAAASELLARPASRALLPEVQRLIRRHLHLAKALERLGFDAPPFPTEYRNTA